jgi:hypothetical protein
MYSDPTPLVSKGFLTKVKLRPGDKRVRTMSPDLRKLYCIYRAFKAKTPFAHNGASEGRQPGELNWKARIHAELLEQHKIGLLCSALHAMFFASLRLELIHAGFPQDYWLCVRGADIVWRKEADTDPDAFQIHVQ